MRSRDHQFWMIILSRLMRISEPWGKATERAATAILRKVEEVARRPDVGHFVIYREYSPGQWWPWIIAPDGKRQDLRELAGLI